MSAALRRSARIAHSTQVPANVKRPAGVKYSKNQGLVLKHPPSYRLAVVENNIKSTTQSFLVWILQESGNELRYEKNKQLKVSAKDIIQEISLKSEGKFFKITKKQLFDLNKSFESSSDEEEQEEEEDEVAQVDDEDLAPIEAQKRRTSEHPTKIPTTKAKKQAPKAYKKGVVNPKIQPIDRTEDLSDPSELPKFGVSIRVNNLNFHRAAFTQNKKLLSSLLTSSYKIGNILQSWGPEDSVCALERAILLKNEAFVKKVLQELQFPKLKKAYEPPSALHYISTGSVSVQAYGVRTRTVQMSRGGREGNNAFAFKSSYCDSFSSINSQDFLKRIIKKGVTKDMLMLIISIYPAIENTLGMCIGEVVRSGNCELALHMISHFNRKGGYGLNVLHEEVLKPDPLSPFKKPSVTKKPIENYLFAPLHAACINPNPNHLESLLAICEDVAYPDNEGRKAVHYAAACTSAGPLKLLLDRNCNPNELDKNKISPLMIAAIYNRVEPAKILIEKGVPMHIKSKDGRAAIHFAAENGSLAVLKLLIDNGATIDQPGTDRKTPLMFAATYGHYDSLAYLLSRGCKDTKKDKCKRTALIWAVKNGHAKEVSLLLSKGSPFNEPDSSKNYPLHYAAAYGWTQCLSLLIEAGAEVNAANDWKLQPLLLAMLKGQSGCVKMLLDQPDIDVNGKDENGRTLISQAVEMLSDEALAQIEYLIQVKKADVNIADISGMNPLHHLCCKPRPRCDNVLLSEEDKNEWEKIAWDWQVRAAQYLLAGGVMIDATSLEGLNAVMYAMKNKNTRLVEVLIDHGADMKSTTPTGGGIFHYLASFDKDLLTICRLLLNKEEICARALNVVNKEGFSPYLTFVEFFINNLAAHRSSIYEKIRKEMQRELQVSMNLAETQFESPRKPRMAGVSSTQLGYGINSYLSSNIDLQVNTQELEFKTNQQLNENVLYFIETLRLMIENGADDAAIVEKLQKYRDDPQLIYTEENNRIPKQDYSGNSVKEDLFVIDSDGNKIYKEYGPFGMQNALHLAGSTTCGDLIGFLLETRAEINHRDFFGNTPLMKFITSSSMFTSKIIKSGADVNIVDIESNLPIQKAIENQNTSIVELLLKYGSLVNVRNSKGVTPLITAIKLKNIGIVRTLLVHKADPNYTDSRKRNSLHIAFDTSDSSANASFDMESLLLLYKADINAVDCRNRCPLHYCFVKIGNPDEMTQIDPIEGVSSACSLRDIKVNVQDRWLKTPLHYAAQRGALTSTMFLLSKGAELDLKDCDGNTPLALSIKEGHANYAVMLVQRGADVMNTVFVPKPKEKRVKNPVNQYNAGYGLFGNQFAFGRYQPSYQAPKLEIGNYSMFKAAIIQGWQGLAYLLIFNGYPYMLAMQDAMAQSKFQLVKTLLAKVSDNSVLQSVNEQNQNLFHTLAIYGATAESDITKTICEQLIERAVDLKAVDSFGKNPLHYACESGYYFFIRILLENKVSYEVVDNEGLRPLAYALMGCRIKNCLNMLELFRSFGADFNFTIKDGDIMMTPLLLSIKEKAPATIIKYLLENGCSLREIDSKGRNAFMYAILNNDLELVKALITEGTLDLTQSDDEGKNALHYVIQPFEYGSYENIKMLELILQYHPNPQLPDVKGQTAYSLASMQRSGRMLKVLKQFNITGKPHSPHKLSCYEATEEPFDFIADSEEYINIQANIRKVTNLKRAPDEHGAFPVYYEVYKDYDIIMTKVDLSYGPYSAYVFYRMQLLVDTNRDVYVLYTRWGRIGEVGASQRTPFGDSEEAEKEFQKIFKAKSANEWGSQFQRKKGKYVMMKLETQQVKCKDFITEFVQNKEPESRLSAGLRKAVKDFTSQTVYRAVLTQFQVDINVLNFSTLAKTTIEEAEKLLYEISALDTQLMLEKETEAKIEIIQEIQDLSSRYFELIPIIHKTNDPVAPIISQNKIHQHIEQIKLLKNVQLASKVILGALHRQQTVNPYDYIYRCLDTNIENVARDSEEFKLIFKYFQQGGGNGKIASLFRVNRKGETERIKRFEHIEHRKLLWHGTSSANIVGILMQGLKIAPPEVPNVGYMFGKGIYFADYFLKSQGYCSKEYSNSSGYFMLICEVVLGEMLVKHNAEYIEKLPEGYLSTLGYGASGPDFEHSIYTPYGVEVPVGNFIRKPDSQPYCLALNEYIVYDVDQVRIRYLVHLKS